MKKHPWLFQLVNKVLCKYNKGLFYLCRELLLAETVGRSKTPSIYGLGFQMVNKVLMLLLLKKKTKVAAAGEKGTKVVAA